MPILTWPSLGVLRIVEQVRLRQAGTAKDIQHPVLPEAGFARAHVPALVGAVLRVKLSR